MLNKFVYLTTKAIYNFIYLFNKYIDFSIKHFYIVWNIGTAFNFILIHEPANTVIHSLMSLGLFIVGLNEREVSSNFSE